MYLREQRTKKLLALGLIFTSAGTSLLNGQSYNLQSSAKTLVKGLVSKFEALIRDLKNDDDHDELLETGDSMTKLVESITDVNSAKELDDMIELLHAYKRGDIDPKNLPEPQTVAQ